MTRSICLLTGLVLGCAAACGGKTHGIRSHVGVDAGAQEGAAALGGATPEGKGFVHPGAGGGERMQGGDSNAVSGGGYGVGGAGQGGSVDTHAEGGAGGVEVLHFGSSTCTNAYDISASDFPPLLTGRVVTDYLGLECVAWDATRPSQLSLDLVGFPSNFGYYSPQDSLWRASASQPGAGMLSLLLFWNFEEPDVSGFCAANHAISLGGVAASDKIQLVILLQGCTSAACSASELAALELPVHDRPTGILCRYLRESFNPTGDSDILGTLHRLPRADGTCDAGLSILELKPDWQICAAECSQDGASCPLPELLTCKDGICRLAPTW